MFPFFHSPFRLVVLVHQQVQAYQWNPAVCVIKCIRPKSVGHSNVYGFLSTYVSKVIPDCTSFFFTSLCNWCVKIAPPFHPIRSNNSIHFYLVIQFTYLFVVALLCNFLKLITQLILSGGMEARRAPSYFPMGKCI